MRKGLIFSLIAMLAWPFVVVQAISCSTKLLRIRQMRSSQARCITMYSLVMSRRFKSASSVTMRVSSLPRKFLKRLFKGNVLVCAAR